MGASAPNILHRLATVALGRYRALRIELRRGDQVVTAGGLIGKVVKVAEGEAEIELAPNVKVRVVKGTISQVTSKTEPAQA